MSFDKIKIVPTPEEKEKTEKARHISGIRLLWKAGIKPFLQIDIHYSSIIMFVKTKRWYIDVVK